MKLQIQLLLIVLFFTQLTQAQTQHKKREMRAVWIATVENIDWPSKRHSAREQQEEMKKMLDDLEKNNINTIVFQARPTADALYLSTLEPWSKYLTGVQGKQPEPYYDPLQFIIEEAHKRFMEVHVWLNPYRVLNGGGLNSLSKNHIYNSQIGRAHV